MEAKDFTQLFKVGGLSLVMTFGFFFIMNTVLSLRIYTKISAGDTFTLIMTIISFVFIFSFLYIMINLLLNHLKKGQMFELAHVWDDICEIDCNNIVVPDLVKATNAMKFTATSWNNNIINKNIILANHYDDFKTLYKQISTCENIVKGYDNKKCKYFINNHIKKAYIAMKKYNGEK